MERFQSFCQFSNALTYLEFAVISKYDFLWIWDDSFWSVLEFLSLSTANILDRKFFAVEGWPLRCVLFHRALGLYPLGANSSPVVRNKTVSKHWQVFHWKGQNSPCVNHWSICVHFPEMQHFLMLWNTNKWPVFLG